MLTRLLPWWAFAVVTSLASLMADLSTAKGISGLRNTLAVVYPLVLMYSIMITNGALVMFRKLANPDWAARQAERQPRKLGAEPSAPESEAGSEPGRAVLAPEQPAPDSEAREPEPAE